MKTRTGKIARLPKPIRDQLNQRLDNGELATTLIPWLNEQPEVQKIITEEFAGHPIRPQNLSQWRHGGYVDWTRHQFLREQTRWTAEQATDLESDTDERTMSIAEDIAMIMSAELALQVQALGTIEEPKERFEQFLILAKELSRLRRDDQRAVRINHRRERWEYDHPQRQTKPLPKPETSNHPTAAGASESVSPPDSGLKTEDCLSAIALAKADGLSAAAPQTSSFCILPSALPEPDSIPKPEPESSQPDLSAIALATAETQNSKLETVNYQPQSHQIPPDPSQNNSSPKPETPNSKLEAIPIAPVAVPKRPFNPHRDYHDPHPPLRRRHPRYIEG